MGVLDEAARGDGDRVFFLVVVVVVGEEESLFFLLLSLDLSRVFLAAGEGVRERDRRREERARPALVAERRLGLGEAERERRLDPERGLRGDRD